jgi:hypothetical protein
MHQSMEGCMSHQVIIRSRNWYLGTNSRQEKALDMTLKNIKFQIEFLEDERQKMALKCISQASTIETLKKDSELKKG